MSSKSTKIPEEGVDISGEEWQPEYGTYEGHTQVLVQKFDFWSMLALAFCVLGTWSTFAQDLASGLTSGGPVNILWGLCLVTFCNVCIGLSLGELCSSMPTAMGQAYWVYRLSGAPVGRFLSYMCAWINTFGWLSITASQIAFMTNFTLGIKVMFDNDWAGASKGWVQFLVYLGITFLFTAFNAGACRRDRLLPVFNDFVSITYVGLFFAIALGLLISVGTHKDHSYQSASFVFGGWINGTGWSNGVAWFTGLVQAAYGLTAFDSVIHMVEELPNPRRTAPRALVLAIIGGATTGFIFMVVCLFCIQDLNEVLNSSTGLPFMVLLQQTIGLGGGAALLVLFIVSGLGQGISIFTTASRLTWAFARDQGYPYSSYFEVVDKNWKAPTRAIWLQGIIIGLIGILYLFATTALEAILSVSTIALTVSYAFPIVTLLVNGREKMPPTQFPLGKLGPIINWVGVIYCAITSVFFFFPSGPDPAPSDMNYAIAVFGIVVIIAVVFWFTKGRKSYLMRDDAVVRMAFVEQVED
ncbi:amino acid transporter-like protein [Myriangium duriaei CBS 260.36]|uniref:Amino acid transporter-like protein n=1 Tax=Myriangium duriaei CBS 260.36 TaxID=1168546 RepID=A0A9P4MF79_9PEZI|nr:amino acid transporter-like protein [Myriangium duriaei CBS 260.36]